jgi:outer membrane lipoprotein-sorting protein
MERMNRQQSKWIKQNLFNSQMFFLHQMCWHGTRGAYSQFRQLMLLISFIFGVVSMPASVAAFDLSDLMKVLSASKGGRADFVERKYFAKLSSTVESSGELVFAPPHRLVRYTVKPKEETIVLDKDVLTWSRGKIQRTIPLNDYPELSVLVTSIRATLSGDQKTLMQHYKISIDGDANEWALGLTPKQAAMAQKVRHIQIKGAYQHAHTIDFALPDGDYSTMYVSKPIPI